MKKLLLGLGLLGIGRVSAQTSLNEINSVYEDLKKNGWQVGNDLLKENRRKYLFALFYSKCLSGKSSFFHIMATTDPNKYQPSDPNKYNPPSFANCAILRNILYDIITNRAEVPQKTKMSLEESLLEMMKYNYANEPRLFEQVISE